MNRGKKMNSLKTIEIKSPEECIKYNVLNKEFLDMIYGWVGISPERVMEIYEIVSKSGITDLKEKSSIKSIVDIGLEPELDDIEKVFAGYLLAWNEYWDTGKNIVLETIDMEELVKNKPTVRQTKRQGGTIYIKLNDLAKPDTYYMLSKIGDNTIILKEIELKVK